MAGKIKRLSRSDGVAVDAPTALAFDGTLTAATVGGDDNDGTDGYVLLKDQSADPSPTSGDDIKIFCKDKGLYKVDSTGVASEVGSGTGSGELNYITNPSGAVDTTGWAESTDGEVDISRTTTASELPRENLVGTGLKIVGTGTTAEEYVSFDFNLDDSDLNKVLKIEWDQKPLGSYADGELEVVIYDLDNTAEIIPSITEIPAMTGKFQTIWVTDSTSTNYELRIKNPNASATDGIVISNVIVGPGSRVQMPDPRWASYEAGIDSGLDITGGGDGTTANDHVTYSRFTPVQNSEGYWFLYIDFAISSFDTGALNQDITIAGITIGDVDSVPGAEIHDTTIHATRVSWNDGVRELRIAGSASYTAGVRVNGKVYLGSNKPTWADKAAPDNYLAGLPDQAALDGNTKQDVDVDLVLAGGSAITQGYTVQATSYTRKGDSVRLMGRVQSTGTTANTGGIYFKFPDFVGDTVKLNNLAKYGSVHYSGATNESGSLFYSSAENAFYVIVTNVNTVLESDFDTNYYMAFDIEFAVSGLNWFDYIYQYIVGFNTATSDNAGLVKKNKYEVKYLSSDQSSSGTITDLISTNLVVGETYRVTVQGHFQITSDDDVSIMLKHDSVNIGQVRIRDTDTSSTQALSASTSVVFTATTTSCIIDAVSASANGVILGNGTGSESFAIYELLNNYEVTTDF